MIITALVFYFVIIIIFALIKTPTIKSPTFNLFKSMFPSWKFFDESLDTPVLLYRLKLGEWKICVPPPQKRWFNLFLNPQGNYYLAYHSHIQQLLGDLAETDEDQLSNFHHHVSYKTTENFVRYELYKKQIQSDFQFKISSIKLTDQNTFEIVEDVLLSPILSGNEKAV